MSIHTTLLPWQQEQFRRIDSQRSANKLGHAWLAAGPEGTGKLGFVMHLARYLLCSAPELDGPCGECTDCHLFSVGSHPDWMLLQPEKKLITIDQVREAINTAWKTSGRGSYKILCIDPAEAMNANSANALLKLLEEPAAGTQIWLISHQPGQLLPTIRSRCQMVKFPFPPKDEACEWIRQQNYSGDAEAILNKAGGAPLKALEMTQTGVLAEHETLLKLLQQLLEGSITPIQAARQCDKFGLVSSLEFVMSSLADLLQSYQSGKALSDPELAVLQQQLMQAGKAQAGIMALHSAYLGFNNARKTALASNNANAQLILESLFSSWSTLVARYNRQSA